MHIKCSLFRINVVHLVSLSCILLEYLWRAIVLFGMSYLRGYMKYFCSTVDILAIKSEMLTAYKFDTFNSVWFAINLWFISVYWQTEFFEHKFWCSFNLYKNYIDVDTWRDIQLHLVFDQRSTTITLQIRDHLRKINATTPNKSSVLFFLYSLGSVRAR